MVPGASDRLSDSSDSADQPLSMEQLDPEFCQNVRALFGTCFAEGPHPQFFLRFPRQMPPPSAITELVQAVRARQKAFLPLSSAHQKALLQFIEDLFKTAGRDIFYEFLKMVSHDASDASYIPPSLNAPMTTEELSGMMEATWRRGGEEDDHHPGVGNGRLFWLDEK